jgi:low affinity Fe/Cu permease
MSLKNDIDYKLQIFVIILLFVLTNVLVFINKKIKFFNGLIIFYGILVVVIMCNMNIKKEHFFAATTQVRDSVDYKMALKNRLDKLKKENRDTVGKINADISEIHRKRKETDAKIKNYSEKIFGLQFTELLKERVKFIKTDPDISKNIKCSDYDNKIKICENEPFCEYDYDYRKCNHIQ